MSMHELTPEDVSAARETLHGRWRDSATGAQCSRRRRRPRPLPELTSEGIGAQAAMRLLRDEVFPTAIPPDHPRFLGFIPGTPTVVAAIADMAVSAAMVFGGTRIEAGLATDAEDAALRWLADAAGFPASAQGTFVSGGSIANLSALVAARGDRYAATRRQVVVAGASAHASMGAAARIMGCDLCTARPADEHGRLDGATLTAALGDRDPEDIVAVVAAGGATNTGAVDDLAGVADVCGERGIWLHVDGAYGGAAMLSPRTRPLFDGIERADSFIVNPHKWLYTPFDCAAVIYRDGAVARRALTQEADYLDAISDDVAGNPSDLAVHLTRRVRGLPLWASVLAYGTAAYTEAVDYCLDMAAYAAERIAASPHLELVLEPALTRDGLPAARLDRGGLRSVVLRGAAERPRHDHADATPRRDGPALLLHQPADDPRRRRSGAGRPRLRSERCWRRSSPSRPASRGDGWRRTMRAKSAPARRAPAQPTVQPPPEPCLKPPTCLTRSSGGNSASPTSRKCPARLKMRLTPNKCTSRYQPTATSASTPTMATPTISARTKDIKRAGDATPAVRRSHRGTRHRL